MQLSEGNEFLKCKLCRENWSRGYCAICGKLVCDECSERIGYARVCPSCLKRFKGERNVKQLKKYLKKHEKSSKKEFKLIHKEVRNIEGESVYLHVGIDDVDSPYGYCTTYLGAVLAEKLDNYANFLDYPHLIRFNPNIPFKTRGNAGIAFHLLINKEKVDEVKDLTLKTIENSAQSAFGTTQSALTFYLATTSNIPSTFREIYHKAVTDLVRYEELIKLVAPLSSGRLEVYSHTRKPQGAVGSLAAIGANLKDYTFELLAYRDPALQRSKREVAKRKVRYIDKTFKDVTFDNFDGRRMLITPHGPDPVLFGLRGDFPIPLLKAFNLLEHEEIDRWCLYRTNQATNVHIIDVDSLSDAKVYQTIRTTVWVENTTRLQGGKVILGLTDGEYQCKAILFPPTGNLRNVGRKLGVGDKIEITGAVTEKENGSIEVNVEELRPISLLPNIKKRNPLCPKCGDRLKSKGRGEYRCLNCGFKLRKKRKITVFGSEKDLKEQKRYIPPPSAHRHLTLPENRRRFSLLKKEGNLKVPFMRPFAGRKKVSVSQLERVHILE
ncbi:MAG: DUF1743 domain-containing protein [Candidatus Korarchaeota archaeon]|nr:DUF1743 domain-containing protein [Candidatus Korarchaeota archaeon]NIU85006.1 DUF1743 domain-containing protein [Candidatus Thorarchaeota archaeon]NIW15031.1 DUF1743 domain-containing protein [Candidatus Thorarchaeota archaeon]NIW53041.1 DUF1743 domain-containing protein [Candidatus Korarchaeota archaeon]